MPDAGYIYLGIRGDFDVDEFTRFVGVQPTRAWTKGMRDPERGLPKCSIWDYSSDKVFGFVHLHDLARELVDSLFPKLDTIKEALQHFEADAILQGVLYIDPLGEYQTSFVISFDDRVVSFVSSIGGMIDVDSYLGEPISWKGYVEREP
jgi:hypothetical protein